MVVFLRKVKKMRREGVTAPLTLRIGGFIVATILLVEDNALNLDMLLRRLKRRGHEVLVAVDGAQGVTMAHSHHPNLILMDMSLPVMDGWEATRRIKANPETASIPVIALTAHAVAGDRERCLEAGCSDYESKPIRFPQLLSKVHQYLGIPDDSASDNTAG
jgi:two-component system, cell cycle response regulator DivK